MNGSRRSGRTNRYRSQYLRSAAWFARRSRWFTEHATTGQELVCAACGSAAAASALELHHHCYTGVRTTRDGRWWAAERHEDLVPLHPWCHEQLHKLLDRDTVLARMRRRPVASRQALSRLQAAIARLRGRERERDNA